MKNGIWPTCPNAFEQSLMFMARINQYTLNIEFDVTRIVANLTEFI